MEKTKTADRETQDEMVGILTAISIVSKRLARRLSMIDDFTLRKSSDNPTETEV